jgi:hypothetical protein
VQVSPVGIALLGLARFLAVLRTHPDSIAMDSKPGCI